MSVTTAQPAGLDGAAALVAALPRLTELSGATVVVKYGGHAMAGAELQRAFAEDVVLLRCCGARVVVVHGGGPQITAHLDRLGLPTEFRGGHRVTTAETMQVVRMVLVGQVNGNVVSLLNAHGPLAVGLSGEDAQLLTAERRDVHVAGQPVDVGYVGDVVAVQPGIVRDLLAAGKVPVVATVARGTDGELYNVNADTAAAALATALGAQALLVLTDVAGVYAGWPASDELIDTLSADDLAALLPRVSSGMAPKLEACLRAVRAGVPRAHVLDGREPHALLRALVTGEAAGTTVLP